MEEGGERQLTDLDDSVSLGIYSLATDGEHLYFTLVDDVGDIWVMDVVKANDRRTLSFCFDRSILRAEQKKTIVRLAEIR